MLGKPEAIEKMNRLGHLRRPFLFVISFDQNMNLVLEPPEIEAAGIRFQLDRKTNIQGAERSALPEPIIFEKEPISFERYHTCFTMVQEHLHHGNTYLANITFPTPVKTNLSFEQIFYHAHAPFKLFIPGRLVVFSPERFVRADRRFIRSYPMKGTIDAGIADARNKILKDPKETAEHFTIVDLIRNDLNLVSRRVEVRSFRYVDRIRTHGKELLQISSEIAGRIDIDFFNQLGSHIFKLLPAGSISGAPKQKTLEIIRLAEPFERGFFTGIFGYFGGTKLDSAVMIRFIEMLDGQTIYKSGGGITAWSRPDSEYQELIDKIYVPIH